MDRHGGSTGRRVIGGVWVEPRDYQIRCFLIDNCVPSGPDIAAKKSREEAATGCAAVGCDLPERGLRSKTTSMGIAFVNSFSLDGRHACHVDVRVQCHRQERCTLYTGLVGRTIAE
ncbi:hypothetical protein VTN96DRAFT_5428 [Rasamsonia emersonii]